MYLDTDIALGAGTAQRLGNPAGSPPGDAYRRHILASINMSTDLPKKEVLGVGTCSRPKKGNSWSRKNRVQSNLSKCILSKRITCGNASQPGDQFFC